MRCIWTLTMLVLITLNCTCLCVPTTMSHDLMEPNGRGLNSNQIWPPQFKLKPVHMMNLSVESNDVINNWSGCIFKGFHNLKVGRFDWFATYTWDKDQFICVQNDHNKNIILHWAWLWCLSVSLCASFGSMVFTVKQIELFPRPSLFCCWSRNTLLQNASYSACICFFFHFWSDHPYLAIICQFLTTYDICVVCYDIKCSYIYIYTLEFIKY